MAKNATLTAIAFLLLPFALYAQNTDIEALAGINFNFGNPGARSLGMGGAFLGLADDASAAETNPAGLTILRKAEVSLEGRNFRVAQDVAVSGTFPDVINDEFSEFSRRAEVAFASVVFPAGNFAFAAYYHQAVRYTNSATVLPLFDSRGRLVQQVPNFYLPRNGAPVSLERCLEIIGQNPGDQSACLEFRILPFVTAVDVDLQTYGAALAWKMGTLSLGFAAKHQTFEQAAFTFREDFQGNPSSIAVQATGTLENGQLVIDEETDITYTIGFKWAPAASLSFGGVYKTGGEFDAPTFAQVAGGTFSQLAETTFHVPDVSGVGVSWRPMPVLTINVDAVKIDYSNLSDNFISINEEIRALTDPFETKDVTEIHAGAEYFFATRIPLAIRVGWWREPAHGLRYRGPIDSPQRVASAILFPGTKDQNHRSVGVGLAWPNFQLDAAYETSDSFKVGSLSGVFRF
ncbi:MAG TPA: hypothetical protein VMT00_06380 [Thermoanaerobaculia bacterium]|nr:hypothetical protein [Thermoanaerobaculia bacterium]